MPDCCDLSFVMPGYTDITCRRCQMQLSVPARILDRDRGVLYRFSCCDYVVLIPGSVQCKEHGGLVNDWQELIDWSPAYPKKKWWQFWKSSSPAQGVTIGSAAAFGNRSAQGKCLLCGSSMTPDGMAAVCSNGHEPLNYSAMFGGSYWTHHVSTAKLLQQKGFSLKTKDGVADYWSVVK